MTKAAVPPEFLRDVTERYAADGYTPANPERLPAGLPDDGADLVFERGNQFVLVQLKRSNNIVAADQSVQLSNLARHTQRFSNVRLDVINLPDPIDALPDRSLIESRATSARQFARNVDDPRALEAALLLAASATEGALIRLLRERQILTGVNLELADLAATAWSEGLMTQEQWDRLQRSIDRRNALAHGLLPGAPLDPSDVETLVEAALLFANPDFQSALDLVNWFFDHYKDPADGVPFDTSEGGYLYVNGGPHDAADVLAHDFSDVPDSTRELAVEQIQGYGDDWVRVEDY